MKTKTFARIGAAVMAFVTLAGYTMPAYAEVEDFIDKFAANNIMFYNPEECAGSSSEVSTIGGTAVISGSTAEEKIWSGLKSMGLSDEITAGIMGNMQGESGFSPARYEDSHSGVWESGFDWEHDPSSGYGVGLIQWSGSRRITFFEDMRAKNNDLVEKYIKKPGTYGAMGGDAFIQAADSMAEADALYSLEITFLINEMKGNSGYSEVFNETTVSGAAIRFSVNVEGCSTCTETSDNTKDRRDNAQRIFSAYSGKTSFGAGSTGTTMSSDGSNVTWIGDSISEMSRDEILRKMPQADVHAAVSKSWTRDNGDCTNCGGKSGLTILKELADSGELRDNLVFALGTNDDDISKNLIEDIIKKAPNVKKVVLVTNYKINDEHAYDGNNAAIRAATSVDNRFVVADWANAVSSDPGKYIIADADSVHPTNDGIPLFVDTIISALGTTGQAAGKSGTCNCGNSKVSADGVWAGKGYDLTQGQLNGIMAMIKEENGGTMSAVKTQASVMANIFEAYGPGLGEPETADGLVHYLRRNPHGESGWFAAFNKYDESFSGYTDEEMNAVKDILVNGNRVMPPQIIEHDDLILDIDYIEVDGQRYSNGSSEFKDTANYIAGKTKIHQNPSRISGGSTWIFWTWANPDGTIIADWSDETHTGDPFGYKEDNPPAATNSTTANVKNSNITFDDEGWITGGIEGYTKESAIGMSGLDSSANQVFPTTMPNGKGDGPNKITLHSTEGPNGGGTSGLQFFQSSGVPPHFTIDMHEKHVFQHFPIYRTSAAVASHDSTAGIQIEIIGYSDAALAESRGQSDWILSSGFSDSDIDYLAQLLIGLGAATGIPMDSSVDWSGGNNPKRMTDASEFQSYEGILGHRHVPDNDHWDPDGLWDKLKEAIARNGGAASGVCKPGASGDVAKFQKYVLMYAWPTYDGDKTDKKSEYEDAVKQSNYVGDSCYGGGVDCGGFVYTLVTLSGWDPDFPVGGTDNMQSELQKSSTWTEVTSQIHSNNDARPGDVIILNNIGGGGGTHHVLIYVGDIPGFGSVMASASQCNRAPMADRSDDIMNYIDQGYHIFRKR